jgi:hypothetical protein
VAQAFVVDCLANVARVDRNPAIAWGIEFGATMLHGAQVAGCAEPGKQPRTVDTQPENGARRDSDRSTQANEQQGDVGAFSAQLATVEHGLDIAPADTASPGIIRCILHHPVENRLALGDRILDASNRPFGGAVHKSIGRNQVA